MRPAYILLFLAVAGILGMVFTLSAGLNADLGEVDTGQAGTALLLGLILAGLLVALFIGLAIKGRRPPDDDE